MPLSFVPRRRMRALMALSIALLGASCKVRVGG
jgi:hypothetical protein